MSQPSSPYHDPPPLAPPPISSSSFAAASVAPTSPLLPPRSESIGPPSPRPLSPTAAADFSSREPSLSAPPDVFTPVELSPPPEPSPPPAPSLADLAHLPASATSYRTLGRAISSIPSDDATATQALRRAMGSQITHLEHLNLFISTWNVGNAPPLAEEMEAWLPSRNAYDLVVCGFQECAYKLTPEMHEQARLFAKVNYVVALDEQFSLEKELKSAVTSLAGAHVAAMLQTHLGDEAFYLAAKSELMQMRVFVFARLEHKSRISRITTASQGTGVGGVGGNKGGVAVALDFEGSRLCFLSVHLAAHRKHTAHRLRDCREVLRMVGTKIGPPGVSYRAAFDHVFFFGDVNSRLGEQRPDPNAPPPELIDAELERVQFSARADHEPDERDEVIRLVQHQSYAELMARDQLRTAQRDSQCLFGFSEADVYDFPPSFKVAREHGYSYNSLRLPSYCDRVLFHSLDPSRLSQTRLWSAGFGTSTSDHKPVSSHFDLVLHPVPLLRGIPPAPLLAAPLVLLVSDVSCSNLSPQDFSGLSDPYIVVSTVGGPALGRTRVRFGTLHPSWPGACLGVALPRDSLALLRQSHLVLSLWDFDTFSADDPMGDVLVPLGVLVHAFETKAAVGLSETGQQVRNDLADGGVVGFDLPVVLHGKQAGRMRGTLALRSGYAGALLLTKVKTLLLDSCCWKCRAYVEQVT